MKTANNDIRLKASGSGVALWRIAEALGITDATFSRKLPTNYPRKQRRKYTALLTS